MDIAKLIYGPFCHHSFENENRFFLDRKRQRCYLSVYRISREINMISKKTKYAMKSLIYLARCYDRGPVLISDLARDEGIPKKFLELILLALKNNGILQSKKGKGGGYYLGKPPQEINMGTVIRILDGPLAPVPCVSETAYAKCGECTDEKTCGIRLVMKEVRDAMSNILDGANLADVLERIKAAEQEGKGALHYSI
jgi:Rrf2 family protein